MDKFWSFIEGKIPENYDEDARRKIRLLNVLFVASALLSIFFVIGKYFGDFDADIKNYFLMYNVLREVLISVILYIYLRKTHNYKIVSFIILISFGIIIIGYSILSRGNYYTFVWFLFYPILAIYLVGVRKGTIFVITLVSSSFILIYTVESLNFLTHRIPGLTVNVMPAFLFIYLLIVAYEKIRLKIREKLRKREDELHTVIKELEEARENLEQLSLNDQLTGVLNRRSFDIDLERIFSSKKRESGSISLLMIDVDFFKKYNDFYGHPAGDEILKKVAGILGNSIKRETDHLYRYGGEEFSIILDGTDKKGAEKISREIITNFNNALIEHKKSSKGILTVSIGISTIALSKTDTIEDFVNKADSALYKAKENGRDRYETF